MSDHAAAAYDRLTARAEKAAAKPTTLGKPASEYPAELVVMPLAKHILIQAQTMRSFQRDINRIKVELHKAERGIVRRQASLEKAHEYIKDLKAKLKITDWFNNENYATAGSALDRISELTRETERQREALVEFKDWEEDCEFPCLCRGCELWRAALERP